MIRLIKQYELKKILDEHMVWLHNNNKGKRADLRYADLREVNLAGANLSYVDLRYAILSNINLIYTNFSNANLMYSDLNNSNLGYADLHYADLRNVDLRYANLSNADLSHADLSNADLRRTNLGYADLRYAILSNTNLKCVRVNDIKGKTIISIQVDTTRKNNAINYWVDLDIVTTGCFQGTLTELKEQVKITHNDNEFLKNRYERVISFIENEVRINKI